jgi:hypothetical protein
MKKQLFLIATILLIVLTFGFAFAGALNIDEVKSDLEKIEALIMQKKNKEAAQAMEVAIRLNYSESLPFWVKAKFQNLIEAVAKNAGNQKNSLKPA